MRLERLIDKMLGVEPGDVAKEVAVSHQHERAVPAGPYDRGRFLRAHRVGDDAAFECAPDSAFPQSENLVTQIHHALKIAQLGLALEPLVKLREDHRMLRQGDLARFEQMIQIGGCDRFKLAQRLELTREKCEGAGAKLLGTGGEK